VSTFGMSDEQLETIWRRGRAGESVRAVARGEAIPLHRVQRYLRDCGGVKPPARRSRQGHLTLAEREEISRGLAAGDSYRFIGLQLGRPRSTISREVARNGGHDDYRAGVADARGQRSALRPRLSKLAASAVLRAVVEEGLEQEWSPEQIANRLILDFPDDLSMRVSHETIYVCIYQGRRGAVKRGMHRKLRTRRLFRHPKLARSGHGRGKLQEMTMIEQRPDDVETRLIAGAWEGDLVMGRRPSAVATLVERKTRFLRIVELPGGIKAAPVREALQANLADIPRHLLASLTWDQGREMAQHRELAANVGCPVYFCKSHSPWQRGTNENTNGLLRQYLSRTDNLYELSQGQLDTIANRLNNRPRKILGWRTPNEAYQHEIDQHQLLLQSSGALTP
jgi:IS30 family transposase